MARAGTPSAKVAAAAPIAVRKSRRPGSRGAVSRRAELRFRRAALVVVITSGMFPPAGSAAVPTRRPAGLDTAG
ncbi:hypothetical protein GCM10010425_16020 [Streptomyces spororaveus]